MRATSQSYHWITNAIQRLVDSSTMGRHRRYRKCRSAWLVYYSFRDALVVNVSAISIGFSLKIQDLFLVALAVLLRFFVVVDVVLLLDFLADD